MDAEQNTESNVNENSHEREVRGSITQLAMRMDPEGFAKAVLRKDGQKVLETLLRLSLAVGGPVELTVRVHAQDTTPPELEISAKLYEPKGKQEAEH